VEATDISETQLQFATQKHNIYYQVASAEDTPFADDVFDLITVATTYHWLDWAVFKKEACRVGKNGCVIAVWCYYAMFTEDEAINQLFLHFYHDILGSYWEPERKYVDDQYCTIPFPFQPLPTTSLQIKLNWTKEQFKGYLASWSASQTYFKEKGLSPVSSIEKKLDELWNDEDTLAITFPLCLLLGKVVK
jgi:ubiquinone/menaquinone biosynthesis C-methylase UbiE